MIDEMSVLDDLEYIKRIDKSNMLMAINNFPKYLMGCLELCQRYDMNIPERIENIVIAGLGGSAIGGDLIIDWIGYNIPIPIEVCRDYKLPGFVNEKTMLVIISYSGETEETLRLFMEGVEKKSKIFTITSDGLLEGLSRKLNVPMILVPSGMQPRAALPFLFISIAFILWKGGWINNFEEEIKIVANQLSNDLIKIGVDIMSYENPAKKLALDIKDTLPVIYSPNDYQGVSRRFKNQLNENSKIFAKFDLIPEAFHNEIEGWNSDSEGIKLSFIFISDGLEKSYLIDEMKKMLKDRGFEKLFEIKGLGKSKLAKIMSAIFFTDFVSFYLSILNKIDPTPVSSIEAFKEQISIKSSIKDIIKNKLKR